MKKYSIIFTDIGKRDVHNATAYVYYILANKKAAEDLRKDINKHLDILSCFPEMYPVVDDPYFLKHQIRFARIKNYLLFLKIEEDKTRVALLRFLYSKTNWHEIIKDSPENLYTYTDANGNTQYIHEANEEYTDK